MVRLAYQVFFFFTGYSTGYRVSQATEIYCGQKLLVTEKTDESFEKQEKRWSTLKQAFIVSVQGSAIIQMTMCTCSTFKAAGPGPRVCKSCVSPTRLDHSNNRRTVNCFHCHQAGPVSGRTPNVPNVAHNLPVWPRLNPFGELRKPWRLDPR